MGWVRAEVIHPDGSRTVLKYGEGVDPLSDEAGFTDEQRRIEEADEWWRGCAGNPPKMP